MNNLIYGEERKFIKAIPTCPIVECAYATSIWGALTLPMGVQEPPYRSDVDGHKNARHGDLAGFPANCIKNIRHRKCTIKNEVITYNSRKYCVSCILQDRNIPSGFINRCSDSH